MEQYHGNFWTRVVRRDECIHPLSLTCNHGCDMVIQFMMDIDFVLFELCIVEAERVAGEILRVVDRASTL